MAVHIRVKTAGRLAAFLPPGSPPNEAEIAVAEGSTPLDVVRQLGLPEEDYYLMTRNGTLLPKAERPGTRLEEGDELGIFPPLKGG
jgi:sulfur carrier protein ThiS